MSMRAQTDAVSALEETPEVVLAALAFAREQADLLDDVAEAVERPTGDLLRPVRVAFANPGRAMGSASSCGYGRPDLGLGASGGGGGGSGALRRPREAGLLAA